MTDGALSLSEALRMRVPVGVAWHPAERRLAYQLVGQRGCEVRVYDAEQARTSIVATELPRPGPPTSEDLDLRWSRDGSAVVYCTGSAYWSLPLDRRKPSLMVDGRLLGGMLTLSPDQRQVSFVRDGELWVQPLDENSPRRLAEGVSSRSWPSWSPDGARLAVTSPTRLGLKLTVAALDGGAPLQIVPEQDGWAYTAAAWSPDGRHLAISRLHDSLEEKQLVVADALTGETRRLWTDRARPWVSHGTDASFGPAWSPRGDALAFISGRGGNRQVYVSSAESGPVRQLTTGSYDVLSVGWAPDGEHLVLVSACGHPQHRVPWLVSLADGSGAPLVEEPGTCSSVQIDRTRTPVHGWSSDGALFAFPFSGADEPFGLRLWGPAGGGRTTTVRSALGEDIEPGQVAHMEPVEFTSGDGATIPGLLITGLGLDRGRRHPALVWAYGSHGQHAVLGWYQGRRAALFNHLAMSGHVVLIVDPRGSEGYGDAHARALSLDAGGRQAADVAGAASYLGGLGFVDPARIALIGHSYGAFLALQTMVTHPDAFAAGILWAGVYDWDRDYRSSGGYVRHRFGERDANPSLYRERNPLNRLDRLSAELLIVHGTVDLNVPVAASERLVSALMDRGRSFEYMAYPGERHDWIAWQAERDFFTRVEAFLARVLGPSKAPGRVANGGLYS